jgi:hypothetical protein
MKTRFHDEHRPIMRTVFQNVRDSREFRVLDQKTTFHTSSAIFQFIQRVINKRLPPTGRATTIFQYSKNPGRPDLFGNIGTKLITKIVSRDTLTHVAHDALCNARLPPLNAADQLSRQFGALTIWIPPITTDPSTCFTFYEGSI